MMTMLHRRVVPVLLLAQVAYVALLEFAFTFLALDTAEIDHTDPQTAGTVLYAVLVVVAVLAMAGGAALLGSARVRDRTPRALRVGWLALLGLGEVAVAVMFLRTVVTGASGPDTLTGVLASVASCAVALSCLTETSTVLRGTPA
ncbi:hypothetical protein OG568_51820 (plasmid) [Streptomyces sp. NBC_01450]|uniref:hypothetical protein n=1 Tax=Streptomyces sp. NBC_01450 TaxID=2903871 RepID=UPI002E31E850|nr:hypothetical protein [Streptomyces sp. NBC_01450]